MYEVVEEAKAGTRATALSLASVSASALSVASVDAAPPFPFYGDLHNSGILMGPSRAVVPRNYTTVGYAPSLSIPRILVV